MFLGLLHSQILDFVKIVYRCLTVRKNNISYEILNTISQGFGLQSLNQSIGGQLKSSTGTPGASQISNSATSIKAAQINQELTEVLMELKSSPESTIYYFVVSLFLLHNDTSN